MRHSLLGTRRLSYLVRGYAKVGFQKINHFFSDLPSCHSLCSIFDVKLTTEPRDNKPKGAILSFLPRLWSAKSPEGHQLTATLVDVFASFVSLDGHVDTSEAEIALDLLRNAFPEADHSWLARRLQRALRSPSDPHSLAMVLNEQLDSTGKVALSLQLYLLINASGRRKQGQRAFLDLLDALGDSHLGRMIIQEMESSYIGESPLPFTRVIFSTEDDADVQLPPDSSAYSFRVYQSGQVILIRNTGARTIWLSGTALLPNAILRLRSHQRVTLPEWTLSLADLSFFLTSQRTQEKRTIFIHASESETNSGLIAERSKTRQSVIKIDFGTRADITLLRESGITIAGQQLMEGIPISLNLHEFLFLKNGSSIKLEDIRQETMHAGGRFRLSNKQQSILVSNDPSVLGKGDLLLSPGLGGKVILRINFDPVRSIGELEIIESERVLFINHQPIRHRAQLTDGTLIRLSASQSVRCRFSEGIIDEEHTVIRELHVDGITHRFNRNITALDNIDFTVKRGEMLCIMGPSGCGKSTLLAALAGQLKPTRGHIRFNGISLYAHRSRIAPFITHMPQEEALNPQLTVREHLIHSCAIRRPHLSRAEHNRRVDSILAELALEPLAHRKVGSPGDKSISGGERGRLNLGLDLGSAAEIFLFDEPISGLSSKDSEHVAESLRALARDKIVIASLHRPGSTLLNLFDKVLLLDREGKVAFYGSPDEMFEYFKNACTELQIPSRSRHSSPEKSGADFVFDVLETPLHGMLAANESSFARRFPPDFWQERLESHRLVQSVSRGDVPAHTQLGDMPRAEDNMPVPIARKRHLADHYRLFYTHLARSMMSKFRNRGTFYCTILEAPLLAFLIALTLRASAEGQYAFSSGLHIVTYLFLTVTVGMFLGLTNSATEILRDLPMLRRERNYRFGTGLYILAKCTTLTFLALIQCAIYVSVGHFLLEIKDMWISHWLWMSTTAITGTAIALFISTVVKSERAALSSIPLLLVPQLLLAGALVPFGEMNRGLFVGGDRARDNGAEPVPASFMPLRYAFEGIVISQATENPYEKQRRRIQNRIDELKPKNSLSSHAEDGYHLSDEESLRIKVLAQAATFLAGAEAKSPEEAAIRCEQIADIALEGTIEQLHELNIRPYPASDKAPSCQSFFQNERAELLVRRAEIQRSSRDNQRDPDVIGGHPKQSIFLDEFKYWYGFKLSTLTLCKSILFGISILCLVLSTAIVTRWNRKTV